MTTFLETILAHKQEEVARLDEPALRRAAEGGLPTRDFLAAVRLLRTNGRRNGVKLIAELKLASPSKGVLAQGLDLYEVARTYEENGASALSVLTDRKFFLGDLETLRTLRLRRACHLPLLRKDFIIHPGQVYESRAAGADAILLIVAALPDDHLFGDLHELASKLGMTPLVEVHNESELERALQLKDLKLIGINNRDLATFETTLSVTERLRPLIPPGITVVSESGIFTASDAARLEGAGVDAILVGEALITSGDIGAKVRELTGVTAPAVKQGMT